MKKILFLLSILFATSTKGQDLSGTWVGEGGGTTYIKLVIRHRGDTLIGYTYDEGGGYCLATFSGRYNPLEKRVTGRGGMLLDNSGTHSLTTYDWKFSKEEDGDYLREYRGSGNILEKILDNLESVQVLRRISKKPELLKTNKPVVKDTIVSKEAPKKITPVPKPPVPPKAPAPVVKKTPPPPKPKTRAKPVEKKIVEPVPVKPIGPLTIEKVVIEKRERVSKLVETIYTNADSIKIFIYDNGEVDGDSVTIFFDDKVVLKDYRITDKAKVLILPVSRTKEHVIDLFANNLGSIPPNTALLIIHAGKKRHELRTSSDYKTNARIVIKFREED